MKQKLRYNFTQNNPYDKKATIQLVLPAQMDSKKYMQSIREFPVPEKSIAVWYLGQNGFILKPDHGPLVAIDPYLTNSCASLFNDSYPFRLDRQLPIFIEPEDLDVDIFLVTHSHTDHTDPQTISRLTIKNSARFAGPWEAYRDLPKWGIPGENAILIHSNQTLELDGIKITGTFALPTDHTDLNHLGYLIEFGNGIRFYNSGDTAYFDLYARLNPVDVDICAICINGGFHNLSHMDAARIVKEIHPKVVIPCHYDMMVNNVGNPEMLHTAMQVLNCKSEFVELPYYQPWIYTR